MFFIVWHVFGIWSADKWSLGRQSSQLYYGKSCESILCHSRLKTRFRPFRSKPIYLCFQFVSTFCQRQNRTPQYVLWIKIGFGSNLKWANEGASLSWNTISERRCFAKLCPHLKLASGCASLSFAASMHSITPRLKIPVCLLDTGFAPVSFPCSV